MHNIFSALLFVLGLASGGYMVVNVVFIVEALHHPKSRLLVVCLNGWPLGMAVTAFIAYFTRHWFYYHAVLVLTSLMFLFLLVCYSFEKKI